MFAVAGSNSKLAILVLVAAASVLVMTLVPPDAHSAAYRSCGLSERDQDPPGEVPTYNLTLKRQVTSCATAKRVMAAFHRCRGRTGVRCTRKVLSRWTCTGRKVSSIEQIFYGSYTCSWGRRRVRGSYQQNT